MMRSKVLFFPMLELELIETYHVKLSTVHGLIRVNYALACSNTKFASFKAPGMQSMPN